MELSKPEVSTHPSKPIQEINFPEVTIQLFEKNLIILHYKKSVEVTDHLMKKVNDTIFEMVPNQKYRVLIEADLGVVVTKEAREYSLREDQIMNKIASAAVASSLSHVIFANLLVKIKRNSIPFKIFKTEAAAIAWLNQFVD